MPPEDHRFPPENSGAPLIQALIFLILGFVILQILGGLLTGLGLFWTAALASFGAGALTNLFMITRYGRGGLKDCGLQGGTGPGPGLLWGIGMGAGSAVVLLGGALVVGAATLEARPEAAGSAADWIFLFAGIFLGATGEELLFHGHGFQILVRALGLTAPLIFWSLLFSVAHLGNANASVLGLLNTALWGALFGYAWWRSESLYVPIGMHFGWNLTLPLFGVELSGFTIKTTGYVLTWYVDDLWSGGGYGPEASLLTTFLVAGLFALVGGLFRPAHRHQAGR